MITDEPRAAGLETPPALPVTTPHFSNSPNARSKTITTAEGSDTYGILNQHLPGNLAYQVGVHDEKGQRRTMEDAYSFVTDFGSIRGQGYFAIFDGHAGKYAAEWCGQHFHEHLLECLRKFEGKAIPDILNLTFHSVDSALSEIAKRDDKMHSGCTAVTAFLRIEDSRGHQSFLPPEYSFGLVGSEADGRYERSSSTHAESPSPESSSPERTNEQSKKSKSRRSRLVSAIKHLGSHSNSTPTTTSPSPLDGTTTSGEMEGEGNRPTFTSPILEASTSSSSSVLRKAEVFTPPTTAGLRRVLYTANAGDARGVLCRGGKAVRLTYDHKGSDKQEARRIMDAGGFVMSGRVNGVLAVTRSLGDSSMKDFVVGAPYTTETELGEEDEFLILACDGLWDVASDQDAVDLVRHIGDAQQASRTLVEHALKDSTDNITVLVVRFLNTSAVVPTPVVPDHQL